MKISLEINNLAKAPEKNAFFEAAVGRILGASEYYFLKNKDVTLSLAIVSKAEIKKLNRIYRKINQTTDVLSFAEYKNPRQMADARGKDLFLGELILCYDDIKEYAEKKGLVFKKELAKAFAHGLLHLLGMRHGKKMFKLQDEFSAVK